MENQNRGHFDLDTITVHISKSRRDVNQIVSIVFFIRVIVIGKRVSFPADDEVKAVKFEYVMVFYLSLPVIPVLSESQPEKDISFTDNSANMKRNCRLFESLGL